MLSLAQGQMKSCGTGRSKTRLDGFFNLTNLKIFTPDLEILDPLMSVWNRPLSQPPGKASKSLMYLNQFVLLGGVKNMLYASPCTRVVNSFFVPERRPLVENAHILPVSLSCRPNQTKPMSTFSNLRQTKCTLTYLTFIQTEYMLICLTLIKPY